MKTKILIIAVLSVIVAACSSDDKVIDNSIKQTKYLISVSEPSPVIKLIDGSAILNEDVYNSANQGKILGGNVTQITEFRNMLYLLMPEIMKIKVIDAVSFVEISELDFSKDNLIPSAICFANATDAYVAHANSDKISLVDIYNMKIVKTITVGKNPSAIAVSGNQLLTCDYGSNSVSIVDTRTNLKISNITVPSKPKYISITPDGLDAVVISIGDGKEANATAAKSNAQVSFIDINGKRLSASLNIGNSAYKAENQIPCGMAISNKYWAFIPTQEALFRINTRTRTIVAFVGKYIYDDIIYNYRNGDVCAFSNENSNGIIAKIDAISGKVSDKFTTKPVLAIYPY